VPAPTSGLARVTIRAPRRRLDLAVPHQVPLAELLPEVLRRAGEVVPEHAGSPSLAAGGWILRRGDGASLAGEAALAQQGVRDGDVLYLVPRNLTWPEPAYDDIVEEIAAGARAHGRAWDASATRILALVAAGLVLVTGLGLLLGSPLGSATGVAATGGSVGADGSAGASIGASSGAAGLAAAAIAVLLLVAGALLSRAAGDGVAGSAAAGFALPYAAAAGALLVPAGPGQVLVGSGALAFASVVGAVAVGYGLRVFVAGGTLAVLGLIGALLGLAMGPSSAASIVVVVLVAGIGLAPVLAVRLGKLPLPIVTAAPEILAAERRPDRPAVFEAVARADEILVGTLLGVAAGGLIGVAVLAGSGGAAALVLSGLASVALLMRSRLFPSLAARLPLLVGGLVGLAITGWSALAAAGPTARLLGVVLAGAAVVALLATAATAHRRRPGSSPYLGRAADILDIVSVVALAPVACAVLNLYALVRGLGG
jgi:type VII secretion integral membrane protein EccD